MTQAIPVSVIVVSFGRPKLLRRALIGISQQVHDPYEVVVVADAQGLEAIADLRFRTSLKTAEQTQPNISAARNKGAELAGGEVLAYIDDDAVPEPTWLHYLTAPFTDPEVAAATGKVLGRNGISVQWANRMVDRRGSAHPFDGELPTGHVIKLEGTNMAIRRQALVQLGGFDEWFSFYLEETDLSLRLHRGIALAPMAVVHHGFAASQRRRADRVPTDLTEIGRSSAGFFRKHAPDDLAGALDDLRDAQKTRLAKLGTAGRINQSDQAALLQGLERGIQDGVDNWHSQTRALPPPPSFRKFPTRALFPHRTLSGRWFQRRSLLKEASAFVARAHTVSVFLFEPTIRAHRVEFVEPGIWVQSGGLFGPSIRSQPRFRYYGFRARLAAEQARLQKIRWI